MKQVIVMRTDLDMSEGKMVAQGAHAAMAALLRNNLMVHAFADEMRVSFGAGLSDSPEFNAINNWLLDGVFTKICLRCDSEAELMALYGEAVDSGIANHVLITDSGATEFNGVKTRTCLAIGPADPHEIDKITGHLKLL